MTMVSDLPHDLIENVLCRVPLTRMRSLRFTCKRWNVLHKDPSFVNVMVKKHYEKSARLLIMRNEFRVWLMSVNSCEKDDLLVKEGKLINTNNSDKAELSKVFHCNGLLLCLIKDMTSLVVWNPYLGQTKWIEPSIAYHAKDLYALGYDNIYNNQKILRVLYDYSEVENPSFGYEIYELKSNSWRTIKAENRDFEIDYDQHGLSLKGNTYFFAKENIKEEEKEEAFLICFDFTRERFGPLLPLPFHSTWQESPSLSMSSVREERLVVLYQSVTCMVEIWVTSKIEPSQVFLKVDMVSHGVYFFGGFFFVDEEKKVAVVFDKDKDDVQDIAYCGYYKEMSLGEDVYNNHQEDILELRSRFPLVCSYFPTLVMIQQGSSGGGKRKERD
ncbi:unnamed protein product [Cochlearia groenlandica]